MSGPLKEYIRDGLLGPVKLARLQDGGSESLEISFRESAPDMRNGVMHSALVLAGFVTLLPFVLLAEPISTILWIATWSERDAGERQFAYLVLAGAAIFGLVFWLLMPPFRTAVRIVLSPAQDGLSIYRGAALAHSLRISDVRGAFIAPHPKRAEALAAAAQKSSWENRKQAALYCRAECLYLMAGRGAVNLEIEVAAFMEKRGDPAQTARRVIAALETALAMIPQERVFAAHLEIRTSVLCRLY